MFFCVVVLVLTLVLFQLCHLGLLLLLVRFLLLKTSCSLLNIVTGIVIFLVVDLCIVSEWHCYTNKKIRCAVVLVRDAVVIYASIVLSVLLRRFQLIGCRKVNANYYCSRCCFNSC